MYLKIIRGFQNVTYLKLFGENNTNCLQLHSLISFNANFIKPLSCRLTVTLEIVLINDLLLSHVSCPYLLRVLSVSSAVLLLYN
jgi:hypothetical protein